MRVSMEWLKNYLDIDLSAEELAETLTRGGIEVGGVEKLNKGFKDIVIGEICAIEPHPDAQKLQICQLNMGSTTLTIVTGASNILVGDKVPVAVPGAVLPGGKTIQTSDLRGVQSSGMLCSDKELEIEAVGDERSKGGILILPPDAPVGQSLEHYLALDDTVLELELYPNRPDCLAMVNVAREAGTLLGKKPNLPEWAHEEIPIWPEDTRQKVEIESSELSWRYSALLVDDVTIKPSPLWMQNRLRAAGVRPINNIVDITNYCMLEMGQPLHAFDRDKIQGTVRVRNAKQGETIVSLDGTERKLDSDMLVIADDNGPLAIAGVMGGLDSEVTDKTTRILFESAHFLGSSIRRTSRKLGLRSESSSRFEKGVNPYWAVPTLGRVAELLMELEAGIPMSFTEQVGPLPPKANISVSLARVNQVLGVAYTEQEVENVLEALNFTYEKLNNSVFRIEIPSYRQDLKIEEDIIEEVARIIGYDRIPTTLPQGSQTQGRRSPEQDFRKKLRNVLIRAGMNEVVSYSFTKKESDDMWGSEGRNIPIMNPLREELGVMRTSLLPGILEIASRNKARRNIDLLLFEIGNVYIPKELPLNGLPNEITRISGLAQGGTGRHWLGKPVKYDFFFVKGILAQIAEEFGIDLDYRRLSGGKYSDLLHPGRSAEIYISNAYVGFIGEIYPQLDEKWDLQRPVLFELDFNTVYRNATHTIIAKTFPRFPAIQRDLAVVVPEEVPAENIKQRVMQLGGDTLKEVEIFDVYQGSPVPAGHKSLALTMRYQSPERTLTDEEVNTYNSEILAGIQQEFGAQWRK
ncbi:phenylalanine--tRNA ligase subunit beta [Dehalobacter sp. DCM]|uniref:phenylalanine--tRNA ligase subunit beta n=1 Tax=Dehalobacter sp. DCM TaxID=2907827 RepID=UPI003082027D|nr:phenylalanine--tRNA ligase subunit beta [Dehalobacter sp. DCM]